MFPKLEGLDSLARRDGVDIRPTLVRVLTDLYVQKHAHTSEEERHYTELVLRLIDFVDLGTRVAVARRLGAYAGAPPAVARRLARDVIEVAEPVLRHSRALGPADFDTIVRDFGAAHAAVIASRGVAAPAVTPAPSEPVFTEEPASAPPRESEIELAELFFSADPAGRRILLMSLGNADAPRSPAKPHELVGALETAALARNRNEFAALLERALGIAREKAERIVIDPSGEPILIAAKALGMPSVVLQRVLMFIDPAIGESIQRVFDLAGLYERISAEAALKIVASLRGEQAVRPRRPAHRPMYYDDESVRSRRGAFARRTGTAEPQAPARTETLPERQRTR